MFYRLMCYLGYGAVWYVFTFDIFKFHYATHVAVAFGVVALLTEFALAQREWEGIDPKKWVLGQDGEYKRIAFTKGGEAYSSTVPYEKWYIARLKRYERISKYGWTVVALTVLLALLWLLNFAIHNKLPFVGFLDSSPALSAFFHGTDLVSLLWLSALVFAVDVLVFLIWATKGAIESLREVQPAPVVNPGGGLNTVAQQQAYGNAGAANVADIHKALSGGATATNDPYNPAPRGPRFDE